MGGLYEAIIADSIIARSVEMSLGTILNKTIRVDLDESLVSDGRLRRSEVASEKSL